MADLIENLRKEAEAQNGKSSIRGPPSRSLEPIRSAARRMRNAELSCRYKIDFASEIALPGTAAIIFPSACLVPSASQTTDRSPRGNRRPRG